MELRHCLCLCLILLPFVYSSKILIIFPSPAKSHNILGQALGTGLAKRGHDVTMVSPFTVKNPPGNYSQLVIGDLWKCLEVNGFDVDMFKMSNGNPFMSLVMLYIVGSKLAECAISDPVFTKLIQTKDKYDIVISEAFVNEAFFHFARHFDAQLIAFSTVGPSEWTYYLTGNPQPYAYIPNHNLVYDDEMNFFQRAYSTALNVVNYLILYNYHVPNQDKLARKYFGNDIPELGEYLKEKVSLVLLNSHISLKAAQPLVPNMIEIGGFHVDAPKALPKDLKVMLDKATQGVIYFSMGSNLKGKNLPENVRNVMLKVFGERKELILWKWEDPNLPGKPDNVITSEWFPQSDLLAHPNVKLFITHGGLLSTLEAISRGVPLLGMPVFGDQMMNMGKAENLGYGKTLEWKTLTYDRFKDAINEMLLNPSYTENAKRRSAILNDQPIPPMDNAAYWVEYVARYGGAKHLRVAALNLKEYKLYLVDVVLFYLAIFGAMCYVNYLIVKKIVQKCSSRGKKEKKVKKN